MNFTDIFKGKSLIAICAALIVCIALRLCGVPSIFIYVIMYALGCNYKNFADWVQETILDKF